MQCLIPHSTLCPDLCIFGQAYFCQVEMNVVVCNAAVAAGTIYVFADVCSMYLLETRCDPLLSFELVFIVTCQYYQPSTKYQHCVIQPIGRQIQLSPELLGVHHLSDFYHWKLEPDLISFNTIAAT